MENLNELSFNKFGKVVHEGFKSACNMLNNEIIADDFETNSKTLDKLFYSKNSPVVMDIVDGLALFCVSVGEYPGDIRAFLLDKTVLINAGVFFGVFAFYGNCVIRVAHLKNTALQELGFEGKITQTDFLPKLEISKVHTLFYQEKERGFIFKGEKHDFWELTYLDMGIMDNIVDGKGFRLNQGEFMFYGKGQHHIQWAPADVSICFVTITFDMDIEESAYIVDRKFSADSEMREMMEKILHEKKQNSYYADDLIICYLKEFIIRLIRNEKLENTIYEQDTQIKYKIENSIVRKSIDFIEKNINKKITVPDVARSIPISQSYLSTIFKKHMDMTLVNYINHYRLEKSKDLIMTSQYNFTQIAEMLGYASVHYFSNQFKLKYGRSPTEYARAIRK